LLYAVTKYSSDRAIVKFFCAEHKVKN